MRVLKWTVRVDDNDHPIGTGQVVIVLASPPNPAVVHVWTLEENEKVEHRRARAYATGQAVPQDDQYLGSARHETSGLVWHVFGGVS